MTKTAIPWQSWVKTLLVALLVFFLLNWFLVSIKLLGAFKSLSHAHFEAMIRSLAAQPLTGLMVGVLATSVFQSSSTTTSLVVGLVGTNFLNLGVEETLQATIPVMIGANIGTSVTNTLISLGHINRRHEFYRAFSAATVHDIFNVLTVLIVLPLQIYTNFLGKLSLSMAELFVGSGGFKFSSPLKLMLNPQVHFVKDLYEAPFLIHATLAALAIAALLMLVRLISARTRDQKMVVPLILISSVLAGLLLSAVRTYPQFIFRKEVAVFCFAVVSMFGSLLLLVKTMKSLVLHRLEVLFDRYVFKTALRGLIMGVCFTVLVQSSSVTTSLVVPLAGAGILSVYQIFPYTMGANVGTTITALLASLATHSVVSLAAAFSHLLFNIIGVVLFIAPAMRRIPVDISRYFAHAASRNRLVPILYLILLFFLLPLLAIYTA